MENFKIKEGMLEKWKIYCGNQCLDGYSFAALHATVKAIEALSHGLTPQEAEATWKDCDLTGFLAGCAASAIYQFSERGEEFKQYWNEKWGIKDKDKKGTVNPAILTINI